MNVFPALDSQFYCSLFRLTTTIKRKLLSDKILTSQKSTLVDASNLFTFFLHYLLRYSAFIQFILTRVRSFNALEKIRL